MVLVDLQVSPDLQVERYAGVMHDLVEHVVEKLQSGVDPRRRTAVQIEADPDVGFPRASLDDGRALSGAQELPYPVPVVGNQRADVRQTALLGHASPLLRLAQQDRPRAEVARQLDVRQPVADHVGAFQVVPAREVPAEHSRAGFARRGVLLGQRAVDQDVVEMYAFALERLDNQVLNGPERLLGKRFGAEAVLIRGHDQFEAERRDAAHRADGLRDELELAERVELVIDGRLHDQRTVAVYEKDAFHAVSFFSVSISRSFWAGVPIVMRRQPSQPATRERSRTMIPSPISRSYTPLGSSNRASRKLACDG